MRDYTKIPERIDSVSSLHQFIGLESPVNPLISVIDINEGLEFAMIHKRISFDFYFISLKDDFEGKLKYGRQYYDFNSGAMSFFAPNQILYLEEKIASSPNGQVLVFHPDILHHHPLATRIKEYNFFSYAINGTLQLSDSEKLSVAAMIENLRKEILSHTDVFSEDIIVSHLDLLLNYCNRFYNRQFFNPKISGNDILIKLEVILNEYFANNQDIGRNIPTVNDVAEKLNLSPNYLSDMLRIHTGRSTKQHIQDKIIEKAKELLDHTPLSINEVAYRLGFEYPQSFTRLFKSKTKVSPLTYRYSAN